MAALAVAAVAGYAAAHARSVPEPTRTTPHDEATTVEARVSPVPPPTPTPDLTATASASAAPPPTAHASILADSPPEAIPALLASAFEAEPVDREWSATTASAMRDGARDVSVPGVDVRGVACRSTICRVDVRMPKDGPAPRAFFDSVCIGPDSKWAGLHVGCYLAPPEVRANGDRDVLLFAFRDGKLP